MDGLTPQQVGAPLLQQVQPKQLTPQEILAQIAQRSQASIDSQKQQAEATQAQITKLQGKKPGVDLTPIAMAVDAFAGTNTAGTARAIHQAQSRPQQEAARLQELLRKQQQGISDDEIALLKGQYEQATGQGKLGYAEKLALQKQNKFDVLNHQYDLNKRLKQMGYANKEAAAKQKAAAKGAKTPEFKADQSNAALFGRRMQQSEEIFKALNESGFDRASRTQSLKEWLPTEFQGEDLRKQSQAERNFVNAVLRRESGAAIADHEFSSAEEQYFERPGDTEDIKKIKAANRQQAIEGLRVGAGPAWEATPLVNPLTGTSYDSGAGQTSVDLDFDNMSDEELQKYLGQ